MKEQLKKLRQEKGVSQREVARAIGVSVSAYANYEQGIREPSIEILKKICKYYEKSSDFILGLE